MAEQQFCLRWNNFQSNIITSFENLLDKEEFVDVTLTAEGKSVKAHKVLLSACSPYFRELFRDLPQHQHPVIVLRDTGFPELKSLLSFIYHGEVNVSQDRLGLLLKTAESLRIKGLAQDKRSKEFDQIGTVITSPSKEGEENYVEREHRTISPTSPALNFSTLSNSSHPPTSLLVPLEPPSHKSPILHLTPPAKKRKTPHSPHTRTPGPITPGHNLPGYTTPGHTPPGHTTPGHTPPSSGGLSSIRELSSSSHAQSTPPHPLPPLHHTTPTSSSTSSLPSSEEDSKVVNLTVGGNGTLSRPHSPVCRIIPKLEIIDDDIHMPSVIGVFKERERDPGIDSDQDMFEEREPPLSHHDEDSRENSESNHASQELIQLPPHLPVQTYVPYGTSPIDTYPGPSGVIPPASQASTWRGSSHSEPTEGGKGGHPVFNELFGGDGVGSLGKKAVPTPCPVCGKVLSNAYNMRVHLETHQDISYKCLICGIITRTRDTMRKHLSNVHKLRNLELKNSFKKISGKSSNAATPAASNLTAVKSAKGRPAKVAPANWIARPKTEHKWTVPKTESKWTAPKTDSKWTTPKTESKWTDPKSESKWVVPKTDIAMPPPSTSIESQWTTPPSNIDLNNFNKGSLASIVSKLSQKQ